MNQKNKTKNIDTTTSIKNLIDSCIKKIDTFLINNKILGENNGAANPN